MSNQLTVGNPFSVISKFLISVCAGAILVQVAGFFQNMLVGHFISADALGGMGSANQINALVCGFTYGIMAGFSFPIGNAFAAMDWPRVRRLLWCTLTVGVVISLIAMVALLPSAGFLLRMMKTPDENFPHAMRYLMVLALAQLPYLLFNLMFYLCHVMGNGKLAAVGQGSCGVLSLVLAALFVAVFKTGSEGIAWGNLLANAISAGYLFWKLIWKNPTLHPKKSDFHFQASNLKLLFVNGLSNSASNCFVSGVGVIMQTAINSMGAVSANAYAVATSIFGILTVPIAAMDHTMKAYLCQNAGVEKYDRIHKGYRSAIVLTTSFCLVFVLVVFFFTPQLVSLTAGTTEATLVSYVRQFLLISGAFNLVYSLSVLYRHTPAALGHPSGMVVSGALEFAGRFAACLLVGKIGFLGACLLMPIGWISRGIYDVGASYYYLNQQKRKRKES